MTKPKTITEKSRAFTDLVEKIAMEVAPCPGEQCERGAECSHAWDLYADTMRPSTTLLVLNAMKLLEKGAGAGSDSMAAAESIGEAHVLLAKAYDIVDSGEDKSPANPKTDAEKTMAFLFWMLEDAKKATQGYWEARTYTDEKGIQNGRVFFRGASNPQTNTRDCPLTVEDAKHIANSSPRVMSLMIMALHLAHMSLQGTNASVLQSFERYISMAYDDAVSTHVWFPKPGAQSKKGEDK